MKRKVTDWFPPEIKPVRVGRYRRRLMTIIADSREIGDGIWDGRVWLRTDKVPSLWQNCEWRGLARKP